MWQSKRKTRSQFKGQNHRQKASVDYWLLPANIRRGRKTF